MFFIKINKSSLFSPDLKKDIMLLWYLYSTECRNGYIYLDINNLVKYYGYSPSTKEKGINTLFKSTLHNFDKNKYVNIIDKSKNENNYILSFIKNENQIPSCIDIDSNFVILDSNEMNTILNYYTSNKNKQKSYIDNTIHLYLIIKSFMNFSEQNIPFCYPSILKLQLYSNLSKKGILNIIDTLQDMNLIYTYNLGNYITDKGVLKNTPLIYSLQPVNTNLLKNYISGFKKNLKEWEDN